MPKRGQHCAPAVLDLATRISEVVNLPEATEIADEYGAISWTEGGCHIMANAVRKWLGKPMGWTAAAVATPDGNAEHVLLKFGPDCYFDAWGAGTGEEILKSWKEFLRRDDLEIIDFDLREWELCPIEYVNQLAEIIERHLGPGREAAKLLQS